MKGLVLSAAALLLGVAAAASADDPIATRKALMKENNQHARALSQMVRGQAPFDAAKASAAFDQWADTAKKLPDLFPDDSKTGGQTRASPKIWENKAAFNAEIAKFAKAVADNKAKGSTLDGLKTALPAVGKICGDCHDTYRLSEN